MTAADPPPARNLADLVRAAADRTPDRPAFLYQEQVLSWAEIDRRIDAVARGLLDLGLAGGERVALQLGNVPDFPVCYAAILRAGLVALPINTGFTRDEVLHVLGDCAVAALITSTAGVGLGLSLHADLPSLRHIVASGDRVDGATRLADWLAAAAEPVPATTGGEDLAVVLYTSGTSGRPRGAMLSHRALLANLDQLAAISPPVLQDDDVVLLVLPLFHVYGLNAALGPVLRHGVTGVLCERFDPVGTLQEVRSRQVTCVVGAPPVYVAWSMLPDVGDALTSVRLMLSGAAPLPSSVLARLRDVTGHHVFEGYGLTETAPVLCSTLVSEVAKPDSIGRPLPGIEVRLMDASGAAVEDGDPGEIVVRGDNMFSGYWPAGSDGPDADGWFATGDVAYADADGDLHLVDRRRELILVSGFNVYPREVEQVLLSHPDVAAAAVLGIAHPYTGETVKAFVVLRPGVTVTADGLVAHSARTLARFKCPTSIAFVAELPHTATGKVSKARLRELGG